MYLRHKICLMKYYKIKIKIFNNLTIKNAINPSMRGKHCILCEIKFVDNSSFDFSFSIIKQYGLLNREFQTNILCVHNELGRV